MSLFWPFFIFFLLFSHLGKAEEAGFFDQFDPSYRIIPEYKKDQLPHMDEETFWALKDLDPAIFKPGVTHEDVLVLTIADFRYLLSYGAAHDFGSLNYFAHPYFRDSKKIHYWSKDALNIGNSEFDVMTMIPPRGRTRKTYRQGQTVIPKNTFFMYEAVLVGNGRIVIIYPHHVHVKIDYPPYDFMTGNFEFYRVNILDNISEYGGETYFTNMRGRDHPQDRFRSLKGPFGFSLAEVKLKTWRSRHLWININFTWLRFGHPAHFQYPIPVYDQPVEKSKMPLAIRSYTQKLARGEIPETWKIYSGESITHPPKVGFNP